MIFGVIAAVIVQLIIIGCAKPNPIAWIMICAIYHLAWAFGVKIKPVQVGIVLLTVLLCFAIKTPVELFLMCMASCFTAATLSELLDARFLHKPRHNSRKRWTKQIIIHKHYHRDNHGRRR